ncbi:hypothetical protein HIM_07434 [Hirsutella minnesotensis 3608]|uniref:Seipin n=1 Tax=Hirsutella minnesotensis 3608 TaxID=1043627 RepID=A0A0F7ZYX6_9HYPO|nr:hypothetical protein HIM_07434 [Hirsutella minnesotensis 3608]
METLEETVRVATSKPVQRAAVHTALLASGAVTLFCLAAIATGLFFQNFVPDYHVSIPVHLQYGSSPNPYGVSSLTNPPMIKSQQDYDVSVALSMPKSPANLERGNFMVSLYLLGSKASSKLEADARDFAVSRESFTAHQVLFKSRRLALVPYTDPMVSVAKRFVLLLYHMVVPSSQACEMKIALAERLVFPKNSYIPASAYVEVEAGQNIHIYSAALTMTARLSGLRWFMFHYRLPAYIVFTLVFWACEVIFMAMAWAFWIAATGSKVSGTAKDKRAVTGGSRDDGIRDESSDYAHTFPTYGRQQPLKHEPDIKDESEGRQLSDIPLAGAEADDEDDLDGGGGDGSRRYDSGLGTSFSERGSESMRRRSSRGPSGRDESGSRR